MQGLPRWLKKVKPIKAAVYSLVGAFTYSGLAIFNKLRISGTEILKDLPKENVLFVSNHQTYFKDVITLLHVFGAALFGPEKEIRHSTSFISTLY